MAKSVAEIVYKAHRLHPALFAAHFDSSWIHKDFKQILNAFLEDDSNESDPTMIAPTLLKAEAPQVVSFNAFTREFIKLFLEEIENFYDFAAKHSIDIRRPNSMNNYGVIVNEIGMQPLLTSFQQIYLLPLARRLFPLQGSQFDDHHSFLVRYSADEDLGLDMHTDDSDVTFNVCLGYTFTGATLNFCGVMGSPTHRHFVHEYHHEVGRAVMHLGSRRHGADDIASGTRVNLIVWNHNHKYRSSPEYRRQYAISEVQKESGPPDEICLSYTHDRDYTAFKDLPLAAKGQCLHPWCPPPGKEYDEWLKKKD